MAKMQVERAEFMAPAPTNAKETREWNRLALRMDAFHARVRSSRNRSLILVFLPRLQTDSNFAQQFRQSFNEIWAVRVSLWAELSNADTVAISS